MIGLAVAHVLRLVAGLEHAAGLAVAHVLRPVAGLEHAVGHAVEPAVAFAVAFAVELAVGFAVATAVATVVAQVVHCSIVVFERGLVVAERPVPARIAAAAEMISVPGLEAVLAVVPG